MTTEETTGAAQTAAGSRLPTIRVPADGCAVHIGRVIREGAILDPGQDFYPHTGEWVELVPVNSIREFIAMGDVSGGSSVKAGDEVRAMGEAFTRLCQEIARRVVRWNWTDPHDGTPLPQPYKRPDVIESLLDDEVIWLLSVTKGETQEARGNGSTPSLAGTSPRTEESSSL